MVPFPDPRGPTTKCRERRKEVDRMALACGCEVRGGMPVTPELAQLHLKHTLEAILFWEIMIRPGADPLSEAKLKLHQSRANLIEAIEELYPEAKSD